MNCEDSDEEENSDGIYVADVSSEEEDFAYPIDDHPFYGTAYAEYRKRVLRELHVGLLDEEESSEVSEEEFD